MCVVPAGFYTMLGVGNLVLVSFFFFSAITLFTLQSTNLRSKLWCVLTCLHSSNYKCKISRSPLRRMMILLFLFFYLNFGFFLRLQFNDNISSFPFSSESPLLHLIPYSFRFMASFINWLYVCIYIYVYIYIPKCNLSPDSGTEQPFGVFFLGVTSTPVHSFTIFTVSLVRLYGYSFWYY